MCISSDLVLTIFNRRPIIARALFTNTEYAFPEFIFQFNTSLFPPLMANHANVTPCASSYPLFFCLRVFVSTHVPWHSNYAHDQTPEYATYSPL